MLPARFRRHAIFAVLTVAIAIGASGCKALRLSPTGPSTVDAPLDLEAELAFCAQEVNRLRATVGARALVRSSHVETFSMDAARVDGEAHEAHRHFRATNGGHGASMAQNEIPWWKLSQWGSVREVVRKGLAMQWAEGAGGGHYDNMLRDHGEVGCGIAVINGEVTVTQDFR